MFQHQHSNVRCKVDRRCRSTPVTYRQVREHTRVGAGKRTTHGVDGHDLAPEDIGTADRALRVAGHRVVQHGPIRAAEKPDGHLSRRERLPSSGETDGRTVGGGTGRRDRVDETRTNSSPTWEIPGFMRAKTMRSSPPSGVTPASTTMTDDGSSEAVDGVSGDVGHCRPAGIGCVYPTFTRQTEPRATRLADRPSGRLSREDDRIWDSNDTERREPSTRTRLRANEGEISDHGERSHNCQRLATARCARLGDTQHDDERLERDLTRRDFRRNFPKK